MSHRRGHLETKILPLPSLFSDWKNWASKLIEILTEPEVREKEVFLPVSTDSVNGFENSWTGTAEFLSVENEVFFRGTAVKAVPIPPEVIFTLPDGFRPTVQSDFECLGATIRVATNGQVSYQGHPAWPGQTDLSVVHFLAL